MKAVALDIETGKGRTGDALDWGARVLCISAAWRDANGEMQSDAINLNLVDLFSASTMPTLPQVQGWISRVIKDADWVVFHNGSFDIPYLLRDNVLLPGDLRGRVFDTLLMARCTGSHERVSLDHLCREYDIKQEDAEWYTYMKGQRARLDTKDPDTVMRYARADTENTLQLFERILPLAMSQYTESWIRREGDFVCVVSEMRNRGLALDLQRLGDLRFEKLAQLKPIERRLVYAGINGPNDNKGVLKYLRSFKKPQLLAGLKATDKGNTSVDEEGLLTVVGVEVWIKHLEDPDMRMTDEDAADFELRYPWAPTIADVLKGRELSKQLSTWIDGFLEVADEEGRIHALYGAGGTVSFRLNCTHPNAQAVPKKLGLWGSRKGYRLVEFDLSQAELRLGAAAAGEDLMAEAFARGEDIHQATAKLMYGESADKSKRRFAKTANFGGFYGGGAPAIERALLCGMTMAEEIVSTWRNTYKQVRKISKLAERTWASRGYLVLAHGKHLWASAEDLEKRIYKAYNQFVQGSIAEIIKMAMLQIDATMPDVLIVGQIHDSLLLEIPENKVVERVAQVCDLMEASAPAKYMHNTNPPIRMLVDFNIYGEDE